MRKLSIEVDTIDDELESVNFYVRGKGALAWAKHDQTIAGSRWEGVDGDPDFAYTSVPNWNGLQAEVENELASYIKEGKVEIDWAMYSEPKPQSQQAS